MSNRRFSGRWTGPAAAFLVAAATFALMLATEPRLAMVWDEGHTLWRETRVRQWLRAWSDPPGFAARWTGPGADVQVMELKVAPPDPALLKTRGGLLSPSVLAWFWPFAREEPHGHPPFYAIVGVLGDAIVPRWSELARSRFGPMLVFSLTAGAIFAGFFRRWGWPPALLASAAWALQPQLFALGHYALYDAILAALWVGAILAFSRAVTVSDEEAPASSRLHWPSVFLFGVLCGWAADTKLTGWFLPIPFLLWTLLTWSRRGLITLIVGGIVAFIVLYMFNPSWWGDLIPGLTRFFRSNLTRGSTIPIPVLFLGQIVRTPNESLPPYNTLVWTVMASTVGFLGFALYGVIRTVKLRRSKDPLAVLAVLHWAFLLALRALPHTPGHDGVRQFLPAFGCLALVAGVGAAGVAGRWGRVLIAGAILEGAASIALMMPVPLSYFSPIVGGLPGATMLGMEPTYYWDALDDRALEWINTHTRPDEKVRFATYPISWLHLRETGKLRVAILPGEPGRWAWYVVQNRPGALSRLDRDLIARSGSKHVLVQKFGVPLIWCFPHDEVEALQRGAVPPGASP